MKFIHISDIHIGMTPDPAMPWANERANDIKHCFTDVISKCKGEKVDLLLISGDLFNHQPTNFELTEVNNQFKLIPNTKVAIVAGSSDYIRSNSPLLSFKFADNVYYYKCSLPVGVDLEETNCMVHAFSYYSAEETSPILDSTTVPKDKKIHILLAYGGDSRHCPIDTNKLARKNFSYIALGSNHSYMQIVENKIYYPGSLEPLSKNEEGDHGMILGEISDDTRKITSIKFIPMARVSYIPITITTTSEQSIDDVIKVIRDEIVKNGTNNIYKLTLNGYRDPDIEFDIDMLDNTIRVCSFNDETNPKYDFVKLSSEHPQDMIGAFIRKMYKADTNLSDIEKKALYLGTHALFKSAEIGDKQ